VDDPPPVMYFLSSWGQWDGGCLKLFLPLISLFFLGFPYLFLIRILFYFVVLFGSSGRARGEES